MVVGFLLCTAWFYTILSGFFVLYCPLLYLMFLSHKWYRKVADALFALWELYPVALFQCCCGTKLSHLGDYVNRDEKTIIVLNHRTRVDWNYVWIALYHATQDPNTSDQCICKENINHIEKSNSVLDFGGKSKLKFVLKDELKTIPGLGWIMQLNFFLYLKRSWREDQVNVCQFIDYYHWMDSSCRVVLFPEGTDLSEDNKLRSRKFAIANRLPFFNYVLHPRTTGWAALCTRMRKSGLQSVYDVTVTYDNPAQTEVDLLRGTIPTNVYFFVKRYSIEQLPLDDNALKWWLNDRWKDKEKCLEIFHNEGYFIDPVSLKTPPQRPSRSLVTAKAGFIFWSIVNILFTYAILNSIWFQFWVIYHCFLFVFVTWYIGGFQNIQYKLREKYPI